MGYHLMLTEFSDLINFLIYIWDSSECIFYVSNVPPIFSVKKCYFAIKILSTRPPQTHNFGYMCLCPLCIVSSLGLRTPTLYLTCLCPRCCVLYVLCPPLGLWRVGRGEGWHGGCQDGHKGQMEQQPRYPGSDPPPQVEKYRTEEYNREIQLGNS